MYTGKVIFVYDCTCTLHQSLPFFFPSEANITEVEKHFLVSNAVLLNRAASKVVTIILARLIYK